MLPGGGRILVTGGSGMVGAGLVPRLLDEGLHVSVLSRPGSARPRLDAVASRIDVVEATITDAGAVRDGIERAEPDAIVHMATTPFNPPTIPAAEHLSVNVMGTLNVLEAARRRRGVRFVYVGSAAEYGAGAGLREDAPRDPGSVFAVSKHCASEIVKSYGEMFAIDAVTLLLFTPFGPWERPSRLIPHAILSALRGEAVRISGGTQRRDYLYLDDVVEALVLAVRAPRPQPRLLNICAGESVAVRDVADQILGLMGRPVRLELGALTTRPDEIADCSGRNDAARAALGWAPRTPLAEGLKKTIAWFTAHEALARQLT